MNIFSRKCTCERCGKQVDRLYNGGVLYRMGGYCCKKCAEYQDEKNKKLLEKIIKGENLKL